MAISAITCRWIKAEKSGLETCPPAMQKPTTEHIDYDADGYTVDTKHLDAGGHEVVHLKRRFSLLGCLGLAFAILNSWTAMASSLQIVLPSGGSITMVWGLLASACGAFVMVLSLAEICQAFPLTGGQYDWAYVLAPASIRRPLSFFTGWMSAAGWLIACNSSVCANFVTGIVALSHPEFAVQRWQTFLMYCGWTLIAFVLNMFCVKILPMLERGALAWSLVGFAIIVVTVLACASGDYQPPKAVFATWTNETGWPDGMAFLLGLLQSCFGLTAFDAATHMIEEIPRPGHNAPKVMVAAVALGSSTAFIFIIVLLFCLNDLDTVISAATGPLLQIYYQATNSRAGATCLVIINLVAMFAACQGVMTVASRIVYSFGRDRGFGIASPYLELVHPTLLVPAWSIIFSSVWVVIFGLIYLGSSVALNAIISASVVLLQISYLVPTLLSLLRGHKVLGETHGTWSLGKWRPIVNGLAVVFILVTSVCFLLPPALPVSGTSMNYVSVVIAIVGLLCLGTWIVDGRKHFDGPRELEERLALARRV